jgi:two-component system CheB/CheR fusion protein
MSSDKSDVERAVRGESPRVLLASEARFRKLIETSADGMLVVRSDGTILFANPAVQILLARSAEALVGQPFGLPVTAGDTTELDIPRGDGVLVAEMRVTETEWEDQPALLASFRDITERKRLEETLRHQAEALREADRRKDEFLAMLAHELRNPLAPIHNAVHVMRLNGDDRQTLERMRDLVDQQVQHLARLVDDLLDVSRITRGKIRLRTEPVDLAAAIDRVVAAVRPMVDDRRQTLVVRLPARPVRLQADPTRLDQILVNLLNNASKYTDPGGRIELAAERLEDAVAIHVRDHGMGISPEMLPKVFDLFAQADTTLDRSQGGLGIGLTLVQRLVELHGGTIAAHSDGPGRGSEFVIRLPALKVPVPAEPPPRTAGRGASRHPQATGRRRRVLLVDDNVQAAESLALLVKLWGHDARIAHNGPDALAAARSYQPDVALLDIGLPGMDGYETARSLRAEPGLQDVLLVATTGYGRDEDRHRAREAGFHHHMVKPLDLDRLHDLLNTAEPAGVV